MTASPAAHELLASSPADEVSVEHARRYIKLHELTAEDVKIIKGERTVRVVTKRPVILKGETV